MGILNNNKGLALQTVFPKIWKICYQAASGNLPALATHAESDNLFGRAAGKIHGPSNSILHINEIAFFENAAVEKNWKEWAAVRPGDKEAQKD